MDSILFSDRRIRTSLVAIAADIVLTLIKLVTSLITGSAALLADCYHSLSDILVSVTLLSGLFIRVGVEKGRLPVSEKKAHQLEAILAIIMASLILYVPVEIIQEINTQEEEDLQHLWVGILGILLCIAIAWLMSRLKTWVGKETDSLALVADGYHSQLDVFSSIAVLLSLIGTMVGIYLDEIVAVIIAVMVSVAGLELLVSGFRSLMTGSEFKQISIVEKLTDSKASKYILNALHTLRKPTNVIMFLAVLMTAYLFSGYRVIPHGHIAYTHILHHLDSEPLPPGLHYAAPWPFGGFITLPNNRIASLNTDHQEKYLYEEDLLANGLWQETVSLKNPQARGSSLFLTKDENLIDIRVTLHFSINPRDQLLLNPLMQEEILMHFAEAALVVLAAEHDYFELLQGNKTVIEARLSETIHRDLDTAGIELSYLDALIQTIKPPPSVVKSHWKQFNEYQRMLKAKLNADSQNQEDIANANATALRDINVAQAVRVELIEKAQGDLNRYLPLQALYQEHQEALQYTNHIDNIQAQFKGKTITIIDPKLTDQQLRLWQTDMPNLNQINNLKRVEE